MEKHLNLPLTKKDIEEMHSGDIVYLTGVIYTGRDAAHKRLVNLIKENKPLPFDPKDQVIYYVGPTPTKPGRAIGSAGPTSSYRMDPYSIYLMEKGLKVMIGKGSRSEKFKQELIQNKALYLSAIGGAAALISETITKCELVTYEDLGAEAIYRLEVKDFYAVCIYDIYGNDLYKDGVNKYKVEL